ncbi:5-hydroxytryptamine receptor 1B [Denticeps clupeoides]|uniref:5-hydroxytryptamine receptor 1B n=1 Tax=Denticeps clupeoides TaxID=299321 RepID=UPI0010A440CF|nr:5-hydroxytryptamine receptor 1B-like [Denticeps clupeoides]
MDPSAVVGFDRGDIFGELRGSHRNQTLPRLNLSPRTKLLLEALMALMCVGAVTGNILVIVIVAATKTFHCVTSILIINLAISDLLVGIGVMPFVAVSVMSSGWVDCTDLCVYVGYTSSVYCTASVLTLAAIALDRYHSIVDCLRYSSRCTAWRTGGAVVWIWLQAMLTSCPPLLGWSTVDYVAPMYSCAINWASSPSYTAFVAGVSFLFPATAILFCYVKIVRVARSHARRIHSLEDHLNRSRRSQGGGVPGRLVYYLSGRFVSEGVSGDGASQSAAPRDPRFGLHSQPQPPSQPNQHHGVLRLFMVISAFFLCWTPYVGVAVVQATEAALSRTTSLVPPSAVTFSYWLVLLNSDINPLLYALLSKRFQGALRCLKQKVQARLGGLVGGGDVGLEGEGRVYGNPRSGATPSHVPSQENHGSHQASIYTLSSSTQEIYREHVHHVLLPGSASCSSSSRSSSSQWNNCTDAAPQRPECLQVPSRPEEDDKRPCKAATQERQATYFYGQITVRVEHDIS